MHRDARDPSSTQGLVVLPQRLHSAQRLPGPTSSTTTITAATHTHIPTNHDTDDTQPTHTLKHLEWFDSVTHDDLYESPNTTWTHIPRPLLSAYHEAKAAVINELAKPEHHDPNNPNTARLWKLLIHMDQLLLHTNKRPNTRHTTTDATASQTATLAK